MSRGSFHKLVEINRLIDLRQVIMKHVRIISSRQKTVPNIGGIRLKEVGMGGRLAQHCFTQKVQKKLGLDDPFFRLLYLLYMVEQHISKHVLHMPAGVGIIADIGYPLRRQIFLADLENFILNDGWN